MAEREGADARYTAFLSYSHRDAAAAARLHRRLETYRLPKRLVGTATPRGIVPERMAPIFRDREELPAATDLSETVRQALAESGALIILCSPNSAGSLWVAEEIETFRRLHPDRPILAAVLDGDPPDCFPPALRAFGQDGTWHEPLATDLRRQGDGARLGLLKLVAGITGVGLDALVQRDAQRKIRRVTAVTAIALIAMLAMAASMLVALDARREADVQRAEAERQRAAAEGQIEFMLTDLRNRLGGVGRIDIREAVNAQALRYYTAQRDLSRLPSDSQLRRARVIRAIGDDQLSLGNMTSALTAFRAARRITSEQLAVSPNDPHRILEHARSENGIGRVHEVRREWPAAQRQYLRFATATERLASRSPANFDHIREAAWSAVNLGNVQLNGFRDPVAAQRWYAKAVRRFDQAVRLRPRDESTALARANAYGWLADSFYARSLWPQSLEARRRQHEIVERLYRRDPSNVQNQFRYSVAQRALAHSYRKTGDRRRASLEMQSAFQWSRRLTRLDPRNSEWLLFRASVSCDLYYTMLGLPAAVSRDQLRADIQRSVAILRSQDNPRSSELAPCVNALSSSR